MTVPEVAEVELRWVAAPQGNSGRVSARKSSNSTSSATTYSTNSDDSILIMLPLVTRPSTRCTWPPSAMLSRMGLRVPDVQWSKEQAKHFLFCTISELALKSFPFWRLLTPFSIARSTVLTHTRTRICSESAWRSNLAYQELSIPTSVQNTVVLTLLMMAWITNPLQTRAKILLALVWPTAVSRGSPQRYRNPEHDGGLSPRPG